MSDTLPSLFDSIKAHSNCVCSTCWLFWDMIDSEQIDEHGWGSYALHLQEDHAWVTGEGSE